jgi:hypothetical protein
MTAAGGVQTIVGLLETISSDGELKAVALEVQRRGSRLQAERATAFREGDQVSWISRGRRSDGVVQRVERGKVLVKLDQGFVARVTPGDLRHAARPRPRILQTKDRERLFAGTLP